MTTFFLPMGRPPTVTAQQGHRTTRSGHHYTDARALDARALYRAMLAPHAPADPMRGPVRLLVKFLFPLNGHEDGEYKITKPDTDNMIKILKDAMSDVGFWNDDAQVASETVEKFYSKTTGVFVSVCVLPATGYSV